MAVPADPPVTIPDAAPTEATEGKLLLHVPPVTASVNVAELPIQRELAPVTALGTPKLTVTDVCAEPHEFEYVILTVPVTTPVTIPVDAPTVASTVAPEVQVPPDTESDKVIVPPTQTLDDPEITDGAGFTLIATVEGLPHPVE